MAIHESNYATLAIAHGSSGLQFRVPTGLRGMNARTEPTMQILDKFLGESVVVLPPGYGFFLVQYDDYAHNKVPSLAYGRRKRLFPSIELIPDTYFLLSQGYEATRSAVLRNSIPPWRDRKRVVFWRGSPTTRRYLEDGTKVTNLNQVMRVKLCKIFHGGDKTDIAITAPWGEIWPIQQEGEQLNEWNIMRAGVPMVDHGNFAFQIDIDGVANAWGFFEKLLLGSCILKVGTPFEQWFYEGLVPWKHFVPVGDDLSDIEEKVQWCFDNQDAAEEIGKAGQEFALAKTFDEGLRVLNNAIARCWIPDFSA